MRELDASRWEDEVLQADGPVLKFAVKACDDLVAWLQRQPEGFWNATRRRVWRERLQPVAAFYEWLGDGQSNG